MTPEHARLLQLALRPREGTREKSNNYYLARKGTDEDFQFMILERDKYAVEFSDGITIRTWRVTDAGKVALRTYLAGKVSEPTP